MLIMTNIWVRLNFLASKFKFLLYRIVQEIRSIYRLDFPKLITQIDENFIGWIEFMLFFFFIDQTIS